MRFLTSASLVVVFTAAITAAHGLLQRSREEHEESL